nr:TetR/AcrR family transcriptional regulator C-terminal domain-containing protein [Kineosporia babensis]
MPGLDGRDPQQWRAFLHEYATTFRQVHSEAGLLAEITRLRVGIYGKEATAHVFRNYEKILAYLTAAGFRLETGWYVYCSITLYVNGFVLNETQRLRNGAPPVGRQQLGLLDVDSTPLLAELVGREPVILDLTGDNSFKFGLDLVLDRAEQILLGSQ